MQPRATGYHDSWLHDGPCPSTRTRRGQSDSSHPLLQEPTFPGLVCPLVGDPAMLRRGCVLLSLFALLGAALAAWSDEAVPKGFEPLFNGTDLTGWKVLGGKADA